MDSSGGAGSLGRVGSCLSIVVQLELSALKKDTQVVQAARSFNPRFPTGRGSRVLFTSILGSIPVLK